MKKGGWEVRKLSSEFRALSCTCKRAGHACAIYVAMPVHLYSRGKAARGYDASSLTTFNYIKVHDYTVSDHSNVGVGAVFIITCLINSTNHGHTRFGLYKGSNIG